MRFPFLCVDPSTIHLPPMPSVIFFHNPLCALREYHIPVCNAAQATNIDAHAPPPPFTPWPLKLPRL